MRKRLSFANVVAVLALFVALGGTGYAAFKLPKNSVGTKQLKNNAVTGVKVKNGSLSAGDFAQGQLPAGKEGPPGPKGDPGATKAVVRYGDKVAVAPGSASASFATCKAGEAVTGGGWEFPSFPENNNFALDFDKPATTVEVEPGVFKHPAPTDGNPATGWFVRMANGTASSFEFIAYVVCASP